MGGGLEEKEILELFEKYPVLKQLEIFIETGTYKGDSSRLASKFFKDVYTFEINKDLFIESSALSLKEKCLNIHHYMGDSIELIEQIMTLDKRCAFFFLDAHQSGADTSNNGKEHVPLIKELQKINTSYPKQLGLLCIDDYRLWNNFWDWKGITVETILKELSNHKIYKHFLSNDRYYVIIGM